MSPTSGQDMDNASQNIQEEDSQITSSSDLENTLKNHHEFSSPSEGEFTREDLDV